MQNYSNLTSLNFSYFAKPLIQLEPYQELVRLATTLQEVTFKQQVLLNALVIKQQQIEEKLKSSEKAKEKEHIELKQELSGTLAKTSEDQNSDVIKARKNGEEDLKVSRKPQITRRNGFKPIKRAAKLTDDNWNSDDEESSSGSEKSYKGRKNPSKAKHLWVNYGRRIIDYGVSQTKGDVQEKIKELTGKLTTKKDFEKVFEVEPKDPEEDKTFKKLLGKLAIYFVRNEAVLSFEGSKYRDEMINQRHIVAAWLERLISK